MGQLITAGDVRLWVESRGEGPDALLIAGLADPAESWQAQLQGLADRYRLVAFDNRGSGRSPLTEQPLSVDSMTDDAARVLDALGIESAHVVGHSAGSIVASLRCAAPIAFAASRSSVRGGVPTLTFAR